MNIIRSLFYGIISACGAAIFQQLVLILMNIEFIETTQLTPLLIFGALSEEIFKLLFIFRLEFEKYHRLIINSFMIGFGFSLLEIALKIFSISETEPIKWLNYLGIIFIHALTAGIIGFFAAKKWALINRIICGLLIALILHLTYNSIFIYIF